MALMHSSRYECTVGRFPEGFVWGAATSAYQIEGAATEGGKGESIWDRFSHTPGNIAHGHNGDVACDHYHRYPEDLQLMKDLGIPAYRFSIAWTRIFPEGRGQINRAGLDFYNKLVDTALEKGIALYPTLYHWDLPQALQEKGGWANRDTAYRFADYAETMVCRLGDRITHWATINEPSVITWLGYITGEHAPGKKDRLTALRVAHNLLLAHGTAVQAMRHRRPELKYGIVLFVPNSEAGSRNKVDIRLADSNWRNECQWFLLPLLEGEYPSKAALQHFGAACWHTLAMQPRIIQANDMETISQPLNWLGVNYYFRDVLMGGKKQMHVRGSEHTAMGWEINAPAFERMLVRLKTEYGSALPPIYITENGAAFDDVVMPGGTVHDRNRIEFIRQHLTAIHKATEQGVDIRGYFVWSLLDNFEWHDGYTKRFGIVRVDFETRRRTRKDSAAWYGAMIHNSKIL